MSAPWTIAAYFDPYHLTRQFEVLAGVNRYARAKGTLSLGPRPFRSLHVLEKDVDAWQGDGIIGYFYNADLFHRLRARGVAVVNLTECLSPIPMPVAVSDSEMIGQLAAQHLLERGYRRFAYIGDNGLIYSEQRCAGFVKTLRAHGIGKSQYWTTDLQSRDNLSPQWLREHCGTPESPVGILAADDDLASSTLIAAQANGLRVPQDLAIVGINDMDLICDSALVPLTSIAPAYHKIGMEAARLMDEMLQGKPVDNTVIRVPPAGLVERMSTRFMAFDDPLVERALVYMHANVNQVYNVENLVQHCGKSRRTLEMRFSNAVGHSIHEEISRIRLERARQLLTDTDWTISRVAEECGFSDTKRMKEVFVRMIGKTPKEFRNPE